ncbi:MAG: WHG domain-containing protein [Terrabacter sp.]|nr:WHG domain-containing protein [Terrabacter sp.]
MDPLDVAPADARAHAPADTPPARLGKRARHRLGVEAEILRVAREHLATDGAAALSLRAVAPHDDLEARWDAVGRALRTWALDRPHDFALIYGSPVPDYEAPSERTEEPGTAVLVLLVALLDDVRAAGRLTDPEGLGLVSAHAEAGVGALLEAPMFAATRLDAVTLTQGLTAWTLLLGAVTSEIFAQLGPAPDGEALFECLLAASRRCVIAPVGD